MTMAELKKCIVLDLDDTLWGGVAGEDGIEGVALSLEEPGASFISFQQALRDLHDRGILLAINSKNNPEDALAVIRSHPNMILKEPHFAAMRMNWNDKADNIRELAEELNIGLNSMVFLDDNPLQRELVRTALPEVEVPEMPQDPREYTRMLLSLPYFGSGALTDEDKMRGNMYVTERLRRESEKRFESREEFLESLNLHTEVKQNDTAAISRISQLTEKTNQFNTNKVPLSVEEVEELMQHQESAVFHARAIDRFGDHGIIAVAIIQKEEALWRVQTLLMSCRVFERGIEQAFVYAIAEAAKKEGVAELVFDFVPTDKNDPAKAFLETYTNNGTLSVKKTTLPRWITLA